MKHGYGAWLIKDKNDGKVIGGCDFDAAEVGGGVELGYIIGKAYWGKGIATETAKAAVRFGFETVKMERIVGVVVPENTASWRVLERLGFVYEKSTQAYGWDELRYYILQREQFHRDDSFADEIFEHLKGLLASYKEHGYKKGNLAGVEVKPTGAWSAAVTVHWIIDHFNGSVLRDFYTTYNLFRQDDVWKILVITNHDE